jgi:hypothetical protein
MVCRLLEKSATIIGRVLGECRQQGKGASRNVFSLRFDLSEGGFFLMKLGCVDKRTN